MNTQDLSASLRTAISTLHKQLRKHAAVASTHSLTELETIGHLSRNDSMLPTELAALTRITAQSMSQILNKLEQEGIVKRTPSRNDGRKINISLSLSGKKMVEKAAADRTEWLKEAIEQSLTGTEKEILSAALPVLTKLAQYK